MIKRVLAGAAVAAVPALATVAFVASPAAATSPVHPVTPGAFCAADQHLLVREGPAGRNYQCQNHDGWRWVPTEPCPSTVGRPSTGASASASASAVAAPELKRLIPICYPLIKPSASPSTSSSTSASPAASSSASTGGGAVVIPDSGQNLPVTGSKATKLAAWGAGVAAFGAVLVAVFRRRRTKFVADK